MAYCVVISIMLRDLPREKPAEGKQVAVEPKIHFGEAIKSLFGYSSFILMFINMGFLGLISWVVVGWMPVFLQGQFHLTQGVAGLSATGYAFVAAVPGMLVGGAWADRWSRTNNRSRMLVSAIGLLIAVPSLLMAVNTNILALAILGLILNSVFGAFTAANMMPVLCEVVDRRYRATGYGVVNMMYSLGGGLGIYAAGVLRDRKVAPSITFDLVALFLFISAVLFYFTKPLSPPEIGSAAGINATGLRKAG